MGRQLSRLFQVHANNIAWHGQECGGPYSTAASNDSEDGRAKNRRVELVKQ